jgi:hypothetical protein
MYQAPNDETLTTSLELCPSGVASARDRKMTIGSPELSLNANGAQGQERPRRHVSARRAGRHGRPASMQGSENRGTRSPALFLTSVRAAAAAPKAIQELAHLSTLSTTPTYRHWAPTALCKAVVLLDDLGAAGGQAAKFGVALK